MYIPYNNNEHVIMLETINYYTHIIKQSNTINDLERNHKPLLTSLNHNQHNTVTAESGGYDKTCGGGAGVQGETVAN